MIGLRRIGTGIVSKDKLPDESVIEVFLVNDINEIEKEIVGYADSVSNTHKDPKGSSSSDKAEKAMVVKAAYVNKSYHQSSVPDVVTGEQVDIYQIGNSTQYFWSIGFAKSVLRKMEHVVYKLTNRTKGGVSQKDHAYTFTASTRDKYLELVTSIDEDKTEKVIYKVRMDLKKGTVKIEDDQENFILLESLKKKVTITTLKVLVDAPESEFTGNVTIDKNLLVKKNTTTNGDNTTKGDTSTKGSNTTSGDTKTTGMTTSGLGFTSSKTKVKSGHSGHIF